jgi:hypothetical protein
MHIAIGAALGEAAKRIEGVISTGGLVLVGGLAVVIAVMLMVRKRRGKARPTVVVPVVVPTVASGDADPELERAGGGTNG